MKNPKWYSISREGKHFCTVNGMRSVVRRPLCSTTRERTEISDNLKYRPESTKLQRAEVEDAYKSLLCSDSGISNSERIGRNTTYGKDRVEVAEKLLEDAVKDNINSGFMSTGTIFSK